MTTKRTHGPCTCAKSAIPSLDGHQSDCPSLYPAQQEPDALTRLVRHLREHSEGDDEFTDHAIALISEARAEQRKAVDTGLEKAATEAIEHGHAIAKSGGLLGPWLRFAERIRSLTEPEP